MNFLGVIMPYAVNDKDNAAAQLMQPKIKLKNYLNQIIKNQWLMYITMVPQAFTHQSHLLILLVRSQKECN